MVLISVIISTYNRCNSLEKVLTQFKNMECDSNFDFEIVIVDNNSSDNTKGIVDQYIKDFNGRLRYLFEKRQGKSYAANHGIKEARGEILAFTDDDVIIDHRWLKEINNFFNHNDCAGMGGKVLPVWPKEVPNWIFTNFMEEKNMQDFGPIVIHDYGEKIVRYAEDMCVPVGCNMAFRRAIFTKYGLFNTCLGKTGTQAGGEDTEFCLRLSKSKEELFFVPSALILHPVEEERLTKKYFIKWFFDAGRAMIKIEGVPKDAQYICNIPAYMYKKVANKLLFLSASIFSNRKKAFGNFISVVYTCGQAFEFFRQGVK